MLTGLPDLDQPLHGASGFAWHAFGRNAFVVAAPDRLRLETDDAGRPRLLMTLMRGGGGSAAAWTAGRLEIGLSVECNLEGLGHAVAAAASPCRIGVVDLEGGTFCVSASLGPVAPTPIAPEQSLPPNLLTRVGVVVDLDAKAAAIAARLLDNAALPLVATMRIFFRAVAPRIALAASFDPRAVAERLAAQFGANGNVGQSELQAALDALLLDATLVSLEGDAQALDVERRVRVVGLRMYQRYARASTAVPGMMQLVAPHDVPIGRERIDFAEATAVLTERTLALDPLSVARATQSGGGLEALVRRIDMASMPTGRERLTLTANLPDPIAGLQRLVADFRAPPLPPFRPLAVAATVSLLAPERCAEFEVRLAPGEPLAGEVRLRAAVSCEGELVELAGPWRAMQGASALLGPLDFGAPLVVMRASPGLLALAGIDALTSNGQVVAHLDAATPFIAVPLLDEAAATGHASLRIAARPLGVGRIVELDVTGRRRIELDLSTLPGFGAHCAQLLTREALPRLIEWRPDDEGAATQAVRIGADRPSADIAWIAASPFRPGVVWRQVRDGRAGPWSAPVLPGDELPVEIDLDSDNGRPAMNDSIVIDGIALQPKPGHAGAWTYVPRRPTLELDSNGKPLLQVIDAGVTAFLQCTARIALNDAASDALLGRLKQLKPDAQTLEAAALAVERIALEVRSSGEHWTVLAESKASGNPPWTAALAVTLDAPGLAAIKAAMAGERNCARLCARVALPGSPGAARFAAASADARVETPTGSTSASAALAFDASSPARDAKSIDLGDTDIADLFPAGGPVR